MSYNTVLKMKSPMKTTINTFIGQYSTPESSAIEINSMGIPFNLVILCCVMLLLEEDTSSSILNERTK